MSNIIKKYHMWFISHAAIFPILFILITYPTPWKIITSYSGYISIDFFLTLSLSPIKKLKWLWVTKLNRYRRELGVASFSYALIYVLCFIIKRGGIINTLPFALHPALILVFWVSFPILLLLAITSNDYLIRKMTFPKWNKLHKKVYLAEAAIILHMLILGELFWTMILFIPLLILQYFHFYKKNHLITSEL